MRRTATNCYNSFNRGESYGFVPWFFNPADLRNAIQFSPFLRPFSGDIRWNKRAPFSQLRSNRPRNLPARRTKHRMNSGLDT
ncbi:Uncharacterized protein DBV15_11568 [Temnothorax longispinosus]|uniref:Uncharacterized protein n=1 Tax=Temnothorax longispinosus TaxID=300112 RepID=A0A4S2KJ37_9HYME|nr:Uncharacterized protein DBV15_11568 [Temnothorax longispinosus]